MEQRNDSTGQQREKTLRSNAIALVRNLSGDQPAIISSQKRTPGRLPISAQVLQRT